MYKPLLIFPDVCLQSTAPFHGCPLQSEHCPSSSMLVLLTHIIHIAPCHYNRSTNTSKINTTYLLKYCYTLHYCQLTINRHSLASYHISVQESDGTHRQNNKTTVLSFIIYPLQPLLPWQSNAEQRKNKFITRKHHMQHSGYQSSQEETTHKT